MHNLSFERDAEKAPHPSTLRLCLKKNEYMGKLLVVCLENRFTM